MKTRIRNQPRIRRSGEPAYFLRRSAVEKVDEVALTIALIAQRELFGHVYRGLQPDYFRKMPPKSGVLIRPMATTNRIVPSAIRPGDIDLLIIPYEEDSLVLDRVMAVEIKITRASYARQGKSPNEFGFSQAMALLQLGFPYVAVAHLIVADESPRSAWRRMGRARVIDEFWRVELLPSVATDMLPLDLMDRSYGRLIANVPSHSIGLASAFVDWRPSSESSAVFSRDIWMPSCREASENPRLSIALLGQIAEYYERNSGSFLQTPRFGPAE